MREISIYSILVIFLVIRALMSSAVAASDGIVETKPIHLTRSKNVMNRSDSNKYKLGFDGNIRIYILNLDRRPDRLEYVDGQMKKLRLNYTRFPAVDGDALKYRQFRKIPSMHPATKFDILKHAMK